MPKFQLKIAGQVAQVQGLFESTPIFLADYLTDTPADFMIQVSQTDLEQEQVLRNIEAKEEGLRPRRSTGPFLERLVILRKFADHLLSCDTLLLHGSAVAVDGFGYIFAAPCGVGKSTHTKLYRLVYGERAQMINDDKPFLRITPDEIFVCGSPWNGKHGLDTNTEVPLRGICVLERGQENRIAPASQVEIPFLRKQIWKSADPALETKQQQLTDELLRRIPVWRLTCNMRPEAAEVSFYGMSRV